MDTLHELLVDELKDLWSAEKQLIKALPKMGKAAESKTLAEAFREHLEVTKTHVQRIEEAFAYLEGSYRGKKCAAMEGLIKEGEEIIKEDGAPTVKDAGLIAAAQKVEHYEIASYGTVLEHAKALGLKEVAKLLEQTLSEEKEADDTLTFIAVEEVNPAAYAEDQMAESQA
jgi:ferritin-like metal-binding protein YciE